MSLIKKIYIGFLSTSILLLILGIVSYTGIHSVVGNAGEVISGNELSNNLTQRETDHLIWASKVAELFTDPHAVKLEAQTDPTKCALGKWLQSDERKQLELDHPEFTSYLAALEEPHRHLHQAAQKIDNTFKVQHEGLYGQLQAISLAHEKWAAQLISALALNNIKMIQQLQSDPTKCILGKWISNENTIKMGKTFPALNEAIAKMEEPHKELHESVLKIEALMKADNRSEAMQVFVKESQPMLKKVESILDDTCKDEITYRAGYNEAKGIFNSEVVPLLADVRGKLSKMKSKAKESIITDEKMLSSAKRFQATLTSVALIAIFIGISIATYISGTLKKTLSCCSSELKTSSQQLASSSHHVSSSSQSLASSGQEQAAAIQQTTAALEEMSSMTDANTENAIKANELVNETAAAMSNSTNVMLKLTQSITDISVASEQTEQVIKTIDEIAFQTNILALNAAVEAARAGEHGAGFAIVSEEVRALAQRSAKAAKETSDLIEGTHSKIKNGLSLADKSNTAFKDAADRSQKIIEIMKDISNASIEQREGIHQVNNAISQMDLVTQENASSSEEAAAEAEELHSIAKNLANHVLQLQQIIGIKGGEDQDISHNEFNQEAEAEKTIMLS
jgi:methyl-accepting chemotaxis protein